MDVFRARADADEAGWQRAQGREPLQEPDENGKRVSAPRPASGDDPTGRDTTSRFDQTTKPTRNSSCQTNSRERLLSSKAALGPGTAVDPSGFACSETDDLARITAT